jgi:aryl-alcohol dehydrogenase-like predicted oxidoreductase
LGINYFDTSPWYDFSSILLANALKDKDRKSYYLATKVGRYYDEDATKWFDFSYQRTVQSVEDSLKLFNTDYIDLIQVN